MPGTASAKVIPLQKDPATMSDRELFGYIQFLKRGIAQRADRRAQFPLETLSEEARQTVAEVAAIDRHHLAVLLPIEDELRRILGL